MQVLIGTHQGIAVQPYYAFCSMRHKLWSTVDELYAKGFYCAYCGRMGYSPLSMINKMPSNDRKKLLLAEYKIGNDEQRIKIMSILLGGQSK